MSTLSPKMCLPMMIFRHRNFRWLVSRVTILCVLLLSHHSLYPRLLTFFIIYQGVRLLHVVPFGLRFTQREMQQENELEHILERSGNGVPKIEVNFPNK